MGVTRIRSERHSRKTRAAAYVRVSTMLSEQDESYEAQSAYYEQKIRSNPEFEFVGVYGDRISGTHKENRRKFNQMIEDALAGKIDLIYCKSISRWGRNTLDSLESIKMLVGNQVNVVFEENGIDTRNPGESFKLNLYAAIAQSESESISDNLKWLYRHRAQMGIYIPRKGQNFGYDTSSHEFIPDENAKYVRMMFEMYAEGKTMSEIKNALEGVLTTMGNPFNDWTIRSILQNEVYVGDVRFGKTLSRNVITGEVDKEQTTGYLKDHHIGLVSRELWDKVQGIFEKRKKAREQARELDGWFL